MTSSTLIEEIQGPGKTGLSRFFLVTALLFLVAMAFSLFRNKGIITPTTTALFTGMVVLLTLSFFTGIRMISQIREDGIYVRYPPFQPSFSIYQWSEIQEIYIRDYHALQEYGGWGIRFGIMGVRYGGSGKAYIVSGNKGIQLILKNNARVLIGTQHPTDMETIIEKCRPHHS